MQMNVSVSRPQSSGLPDLTWQTDTKYTALNVMTSEDTMETDLTSGGYIDPSGKVYAQNFKLTFSYYASSFYAPNDQLGVTANLTVGPSGNFQGGTSLSYEGTHVFTKNDSLVFYLDIGTPPANWTGPVVIGALYNLGKNLGVSGQWQGTFGSNDPWNTVPPEWFFGANFIDKGFNASLQVNPQGAQLGFKTSF